MLCPNCHQPITVDATYCGNCGFKLPPVNVTPADHGPVTVNPTAAQHHVVSSPVQPSLHPISNHPTIATPSPILNGPNTPAGTTRHSHDGLAIAALVIGVLSCLAWAAPFFGTIFCALALIFGIISLRSHRRGFAITGIILGSITTLLSVLWLVLIFVIGISAFKSAGSTIASTKTILSPCYTAKIPGTFKLTQQNGSCTFSATDALTGEFYEVKVMQVSSLTSNNLNDGAKADVQNVLSSIPGSSITNEQDGTFAGHQAYVVTLASTDGSSGTVDYVYSPTSQGNLVIVLHTQHAGTNKGLSALENSWSWQ